jgi:hypothetical protein
MPKLFYADGRHYPEACPECFRRPITPEHGRGTFSVEGLRHLYCATTYGEVELADGTYWSPPHAEHDQWQPQFIICAGDTGRGKTRAAWAVLAGPDAGEVPAIEYVRAVDFASEIPARAKRNELAGESAIGEYHDRLTSKYNDYLFIDDFGQCPLRGRVCVELWNLIDRLYTAEAPRVIITTQAARGGALFQALKPEDAFRVKAMLRRIRDSAYLVDFDRGEGFVVRGGVSTKIDLPAPRDVAPGEALSESGAKPERNH